MLLSKTNVIRFNVVIEPNNPYFEACKKFNATKYGATDVVEALRWEFEQEKRLEDFDKMSSGKGFSFHFEKELQFGGLGYTVEYATKIQCLY